VVITRPEAQSGTFAECLQAQGARVIHFPTIRIVPPASWEACDAAIAHIEDYQWIVFTSANGVRSFFARLDEAGRDIRDLKGVRLGAIGPVTASTVESLGLRVDLVPDAYLSEGVVRAFENCDLHGARILLPRAEVARDVLPEGLSKQGAQVEAVVVYRTVGSGRNRKELDAYLAKGLVDVLSFTSPSTFTHFLEIMGRDFVPPPAVRIAAIGPVTAAALTRAGWPVHILQETYTIPGLVEAMETHFRKDRRNE
jgi:uroporphyrinogen III methyltransferase/synthase